MRNLALFLTVTALVAGCGPDHGGTCGKVPACGGDAVGTWRYESYCGELADFSFPDKPCPQAKAVATNLSRTGTLTLGADGSFQETVTVQSTVTLEVPAFCLPDGGSCESLGSTAGAQVESMSCSPSASGCRCTQVSSSTVASSGTATIEGTTLTLASPGNIPSELAYCVRGDQLHLDMIVTPLATGKPSLLLGILARRQ